MSLPAPEMNDSSDIWQRQMAAGWVRRIITGDSPGEWAHNTDAEIQFAISVLNLRRGDHILDLGCGWGRHSVPLAHFGLRVTALDVSHELVTLARYNAQRAGVDVKWIESDIATAPVSGTFDAIVQFCGNFLTWFSSRTQALQVLRQVVTFLKPGGRLLLGQPDWQPHLPQRAQDYEEWQGGAAIYRHRYDEELRMAHKQVVIFGPEHERREFTRLTWWPSQHDMESLFEQAGLEICARFNTCSLAPYNSADKGLIYLLQRRGE